MDERQTLSRLEIDLLRQITLRPPRSAPETRTFIPLLDTRSTNLAHDA